MAATDRMQIVRDCFRAYEQNDRALIEPHLSVDFRFFSPADVGIDREQYFERCWPNAVRLDTFKFLRLTEAGEEVLVTYQATRCDGTRFCNTELFRFDADGFVNRVEVYFGWNLD